MPYNKYMGKENAVQLHNGILFRCEEDGITREGVLGKRMQMQQDTPSHLCVEARKSTL